MSDIKKFLFDLHDFDEDAIAKAQEEEEPPAPTFSEEEIEAAKAEAYQKGRLAGIDEERANITQQIADTLDSFSNALQPLMQAEDQRRKQFVDDCIAMTTDALEQAFPEIYDKTNLDILKDHIIKVVNQNLRRSKLLIIVNPAQKDAIEKHVMERIEPDKHDINIKIAAQDHIPAGHTEIKWQHGGAIWTPLNLQNEILQVFKEHMPEHYTPLDAPAESEKEHDEGENNEEDIMDADTHIDTEPPASQNKPAEEQPASSTTEGGNDVEATIDAETKKAHNKESDESGSAQDTTDEKDK